MAGALIGEEFVEVLALGSLENGTMIVGAFAHRHPSL
jgi:hypothetical protein